jgi:hypothetical protein
MGQEQRDATRAPDQRQGSRTATRSRPSTFGKWYVAQLSVVASRCALPHRWYGSWHDGCQDDRRRPTDGQATNDGTVLLTAAARYGRGALEERRQRCCDNRGEHAADGRRRAPGREPARVQDADCHHHAKAGGNCRDFRTVCGPRTPGLQDYSPSTQPATTRFRTGCNAASEPSSLRRSPRITRQSQILRRVGSESRRICSPFVPGPGAGRGPQNTGVTAISGALSWAQLRSI